MPIKRRTIVGERADQMQDATGLEWKKKSNGWYTAEHGSLFFSVQKAPNRHRWKYVFRVAGTDVRGWDHCRGSAVDAARKAKMSAQKLVGAQGSLQNVTDALIDGDDSD